MSGTRESGDINETALVARKLSVQTNSVFAVVVHSRNHQPIADPADVAISHIHVNMRKNLRSRNRILHYVSVLRLKLQLFIPVLA